MSLDVFSGPLDLLLYLVHNHELDPRTIPISQIAEQYLAFLDEAHENQLGIAGEYLVMAAKLLALKARELLPREEQGELEPEEFDGFDREELVRQLLEYRRFKQAAEKLRGLESRVWGTFPRGQTDSQGDRPQEDDDDSLEAGLVGLFDLLKAFRQVLAVRPRTAIHEIEIDDIPIQERMNRIRAHLLREGRAHFDELYPHDGRKLLPVVTFMAILELVKTEEVAFRQAGTWQPLMVYRPSDERYADEMARMDQVFTPDPEFNPDVLGLLAEKERRRLEAMAREEAMWGGSGIDPETGELLPGPVPAGEAVAPGMDSSAAGEAQPQQESQPAQDGSQNAAQGPEIAPESPSEGMDPLEPGSPEPSDPAPEAAGEEQDLSIDGQAEDEQKTSEEASAPSDEALSDSPIEESSPEPSPEEDKTEG
ncbi:MAG: segregation/condensation protein A [Fibrobacterota bacterium]|nr:MAG: segregation/condensation protein A [Fibrobacterota bacterium]